MEDFRFERIGEAVVVLMVDGAEVAVFDFDDVPRMISQLNMIHKQNWLTTEEERIAITLQEAGMNRSAALQIVRVVVNKAEMRGMEAAQEKSSNG